jgi:preprotein translocase subunit SecF
MNYKKLIVIPVVLIALSLIYLFWLILTTGLNLDIDLKGGTQIVFDSPVRVNEQELEDILKPYDASIRTAEGITGYSVFIEFDASVEPNNVLETLKENNYDVKDYSIQTVGPTLGKAFFEQALIALIFAFLFMAGAAFVIFRKPVLSLRIIFSAFADIIETLVLSQIIGIKLSLATFAAILLLIGYSADDDVMLTARVTKGTGEINERIKRARKTAFTMIGATAVALLSLFLITSSTVIIQIASIMLIGLTFDLINTWMFNAPVLRWYAEKIKMT